MRKMIKHIKWQCAALYPRWEEVQYIWRANKTMAAERWPHTEELAIKMQLSGFADGSNGDQPHRDAGKRLVADFELKIFAHALGVTMEWLTTENENEAPCFCMALHYSCQMAPCFIFDPQLFPGPAPGKRFFDPLPKKILRFRTRKAWPAAQQYLSRARAFRFRAGG
ncbi:MAG: hypothetical protein ACLR1M_10775 [Oscillospiraceae bacterium]